MVQVYDGTSLRWYKFTMVQVYDGTSIASPHPPRNLRRLVILRCLHILVLRLLRVFRDRRFIKRCVKSNQFIYVLLIYIIL